MGGLAASRATGISFPPVAAFRSFVAHPGALDRRCRPKDHDSIRVSQGLLDLLGILSAAADLLVPPDLVRSFLEGSRDFACLDVVVPVIAQEYARHRTAPGSLGMLLPNGGSGK